MAIATDLEQYFLLLVNGERAKEGLSLLKLEQRLNDAADAHSQWMGDAAVLSHSGDGGSDPGERMEAANFTDGGRFSWAENVSVTQDNKDGTLKDEVERLHQALMDSPSHRANILNPNWEYIGIGLDVGQMLYPGVGTRDSAFVTQKFATTDDLVRLDIMGTSIGETLTGENGHDHFDGRGGNDSIAGALGDDRIKGGSGNDDLKGDGGDDIIEGGAGNDFIRGGREEDTLQGGDGDDVIRGQRNADRLEGGDGADNLKGGGGNDTLFGNLGNDFLKGGSREDELDGGFGNDKLFGNSFDDVLRGNRGDDTLNAGGDDDTLLGGSGNDWIKGGSGADVFVFYTGDGADRIVDFELGVDELHIDDTSTSAGSAAALVRAHGSVEDGDAVLRLDGVTITLDGVSDLDALANDLILF